MNIGAKPRKVAGHELPWAHTQPGPGWGCYFLAELLRTAGLPPRARLWALSVAGGGYSSPAMVHFFNFFFFFPPSRSVAKPEQNKPCLHPRQADYVCRQPKQIIPPATRSEPGGFSRRWVRAALGALGPAAGTPSPACPASPRPDGHPGALLRGWPRRETWLLIPSSRDCFCLLEGGSWCLEEVFFWGEMRALLWAEAHGTRARGREERRHHPPAPQAQSQPNGRAGRCHSPPPAPSPAAPRAGTLR